MLLLSTEVWITGYLAVG